MNSSIMLQLATELGEKLLGYQWHISGAESCTGGGIGYAITSVPGSSAWFSEGYITYSNEAKTKLVNVPAELLAQYGAVSQQVVEAMAKGAAQRSGAQMAFSVSGIAGPDGGSPEKPVGTVWFGLYKDGQLYSVCQQFSGDRHQVRQQAIVFSLQYCLEYL